ncbi:MAG: NAD(P)H-hydrate dehydratase [Firmicutes bacterium]|nr:NAD(P)H-hydrate dehydratase [Bacillota bacterium]
MEFFTNPCMITAETVKNRIERRNREIHKGDCGRILLVAGSEGMMGAAILAARGALRSGAGLVQMTLPKELFPIAQTAVPEATCLTRAFQELDVNRYDAIAVGPGLGTNWESVETVKHILYDYHGSLVLDADALNIIAKPKYGLFPVLRERQGETVITPHMGEARRLLDGSDYAAKREKMKGTYSQWAHMQQADPAVDRKAMAHILAEETGAVVALKGAGTIVATLEGQTYTNTTGNPGMATGGAGDVLTGIIAGLWGQKMASGSRLDAMGAAVCGVYLHGLSGDLAAEKLGEHGLIAGDLVEFLPVAMKNTLT